MASRENIPNNNSNYSELQEVERVSAGSTILRVNDQMFYSLSLRLRQILIHQLTGQTFGNRIARMYNRDPIVNMHFDAENVVNLDRYATFTGENTRLLEILASVMSSTIDFNGQLGIGSAVFDTMNPEYQQALLQLQGNTQVEVESKSADVIPKEILKKIKRQFSNIGEQSNALRHYITERNLMRTLQPLFTVRRAQEEGGEVYYINSGLVSLVNTITQAELDQEGGYLGRGFEAIQREPGVLYNEEQIQRHLFASGRRSRDGRITALHAFFLGDGVFSHRHLKDIEPTIIFLINNLGEDLVTMPNEESKTQIEALGTDTLPVARFVEPGMIDQAREHLQPESKSQLPDYNEPGALIGEPDPDYNEPDPDGGNGRRLSETRPRRRRLGFFDFFDDSDDREKSSPKVSYRKIGQAPQRLARRRRRQPQPQLTIENEEGRDARTLGRGAGAGALAGLAIGAGLVGGNALAGAVSGAGTAGLVGEALSQREVGGDGQLGGQQNKFGSGQRAGSQGREQGFTRDDDGDGISNNWDPNPNKASAKMDFIGSVEGVAGEEEYGVPTDNVSSSLKAAAAAAAGLLNSLGQGESALNTSESDLQKQKLYSPAPAAPAPAAPVAPAPPPLVPSDKIPDDAQAHNDSNADTKIHDITDKTPPDEQSIFKSALSGLSIALVEYIKKVDPNIEMALSVMERTGFQLPEIINGAVRNVVSQISQISHMDTAGVRTNKKNRMKLRQPGDEHKMLKNPVFYPFIIIAIRFYSTTKNINLDLNYFTAVALGQVLKRYLKLPPAYITYAIRLLQNFPNELEQAYLNNRNQSIGITPDQTMAIKKYIEFIKSEYKNNFGEDYITAVKKTEYGSSTLTGVLDHLNNPRMLNVVYSVMMTIDNFILTIQNNDNVLLGLMGLVYAEAINSGDLVDANIISNSNVLGYVYFQGSMPMMGRKDIELEALKQMSKPKDERRLESLNLIKNKEKVAMWEDNNGNAIVTIRGTDHKDSGDIIDNFLNFGGSKELKNTRRYLTARKFINDKESEISNTGRGSIKVLGYSLGGATATRLSQDYHYLPIKVFNPIISNSQMQKDLFKKLKELNSNIEFFYVDEDPISTNLKDYRNDFRMNMVKKNKFFSSHSLNNHG